jgi:hypothetical protein
MNNPEPRRSSKRTKTPKRSISVKDGKLAPVYAVPVAKKISQGTLTRKFRREPIVMFINKNHLDVKLITALLNIAPREAIIKMILFGLNTQYDNKIVVDLIRKVLYTLPKPVLINMVIFGYKSQGPGRQKQIFKMIHNRQSVVN